MNPIRKMKKIAYAHPVPTLILTATAGAYLGSKVTDTILTNLSTEIVIKSWVKGVENAGKSVHILDKTQAAAVAALAKN